MAVTEGSVVARIYVPMEMGAFARILSAIAKEFPDAVLGEPSSDGEVVVTQPPLPSAGAVVKGLTHSTGGNAG